MWAGGERSGWPAKPRCYALAKGAPVSEYQYYEFLAVDRPLDMLRTATNVLSDSVGAAIVARREGEALAPGLAR